MRVLAALLLALAACGDGGGSSGFADGGADGPLNDARLADAAPPDALVIDACSQAWRVDKVGGIAVHSAVISGRALVLSSSNAIGGNLLTVTNLGTLSGDFDLALAYDGLVLGGPDAVVAAELVHDPDVPFRALLANLPMPPRSPGVAVTFQSGVSSRQATTASAGTIRFQRTGGIVTASIQPASGEPAALMLAYALSPLTLRLTIGSSGANVPPETTVHFRSLLASGGIASDDFSCDTLVAQ